MNVNPELVFDKDIRSDWFLTKTPKQKKLAQSKQVLVDLKHKSVEHP